MLLPNPERVVLEPREQVRHTAWDGGVDAQLVDHFDASLSE